MGRKSAIRCAKYSKADERGGDALSRFTLFERSVRLAPSREIRGGFLCPVGSSSTWT